MSDESAPSWYAVRCIFRHPATVPVEDGGGAAPDGNAYEERITLWRASSAEEAIGRAEEQAERRARALADAGTTYLYLAQSYRLVDEPSDGAELFSLVRESDLEPDAYLDAFFDTGSEDQRIL
jgi:hypothetical protein